MEYSVHSKDDKTRHVIARTKCSSHSTHPLDFKLCKQIHMAKMKYYKIY
jgi:hypothetical protein